MAKLFSKLNRYRKYILFFCDFVLWNISYYLSFTIIRSSYLITGLEKTFFMTFLVMNVSFIVVFLLFRLYDKIWRYADVEAVSYTHLDVYKRQMWTLSTIARRLTSLPLP